MAFFGLVCNIEAARVSKIGRECSCHFKFNDLRIGRDKRGTRCQKVQFQKVNAGQPPM